MRPPRSGLLSLVPPPPESALGALDDDALMACSAAGQEQAYAQLVERYQRRVRGFCRMLLRDETVAYDLAQDVFLKIWQRRAHYRAQGRFREFLFMVARNTCRSYARKRAVYDLFGLAALPEPLDHARLSAATSSDERLHDLEVALLRLPERFRVPLTLRFVEGLDYAEIARVIQRTESGARSRVFHGLKQLAALLPEGAAP